MRLNTFVAMCAGSLLTGASFGQTILYVDADAPGAVHDGSSWEYAYRNPQDALAVATAGTEIRVAQRTYMPDGARTPLGGAHLPGSGDRAATFQLINNVGLNGGYAGYGELDPGERDIDAYETTLSGDLFGDDGPDFANYVENSYHVVTGSNVDETAALDGCSIRAGNANDGKAGAGAYIIAGNPTFSNCRFTENSTYSVGGASFIQDNARPVFSRCTFSFNRAHQGGAVATGLADPRFENCAFVANSATGAGGGIESQGGSLSLIDSIFSTNMAAQGGGVEISNGDATMANCIFVGNEASWGGAIEIQAPQGGDVTLINCIFSGNNADGWFGGGGLNIIRASPTMTNCTFTGNSASNGGGVSSNDGSNPMVRNCILWDNIPDQIGGPATVVYGDLQGGWFGDGGNNIDADPIFVRDPDDGGDGWGDDPATPEIDEGANDDYGDLHLPPGSPCIDAGDNMAVPQDVTDLDGDGNTTEPTPFDLDLHPRFVNDLATDDMGNPSAEFPERIVDIGAYEAATAGDYNWDGYVCLLDYEVFCSCLTGPGGEATPSCRMLDLDGDGDVDLIDHGDFQYWFTGSAP